VSNLALPKTSHLHLYLSSMVERQASDMFLTVGAPPSIKVQGEVLPLPFPSLQADEVQALSASLLSDSQSSRFEAEMECDLAGVVEGLGRFRFNVYRQRGELAIVVRHIQSTLPSVAQLHMPAILETLAMYKRGLVLIVGAAGSGKSTTLASMIDYRNMNQSGHILTIEDPIEFVHSHKQSIVSQREVGVDTQSFDQALRHAMREAPDVIMIGEMRDRLTVQHAINYAETGHLCLSTLHANNAHQAIERIINFYPEDAHKRVQLDLSLNLHAVVAQRLIHGVNNQRMPATEVMLRSPYVADLINKGQIDQLRGVIAKSNDIGMHTFDQSLFSLFADGLITLEQAIDNADSRTDLSVRLRIELGATLEPSGLSY